MRTNTIKITILLCSFISTLAYSQSKTGMDLLHNEKWWSAEKEFAKSTEDIDQFYKGFSQIKMNDLDKAKATFNTISTKPYGKIGLGWLELNNNNQSGANKLFEEAANETKNKNSDIFIAISRAIANSTANSKDEAITWAGKAVEMQKKNADYRVVYGEAYLSNSDGGKANIQYEYAIEYNPSSSIPLAKIGQSYFRARTYDFAKEYLNKALDKNPNDLFALNYISQLYYKSKKYDSAKMFQARVLELGDKNPEDLAQMANIYFNNKEYESAIQQISEIIKGDNKYNFLNRLIGYSYFETKKPNEAKDFLTKFLETQPKDKIIASDYEYLGKAQLETGDTVNAIATMKKSLDIKQDDKEALQNLATLFKSIKRYDDALEIYNKIVALPEPVADDYFQIAGIHFAKKDYTNAELYYTKVLELKPESAAAYFQRANTKRYGDPNQETASAKPDFVKFTELGIGQEAKFKKQYVVAYIYLAKDAIKNLQDKALGQSFIDKTLAIDPENKEAIELMEFTK